MTRLDGRCVGGRRIAEATPGGHWKILTILSAMSTRGMIATMTIEEPTDGDIFLAYVEHVPCPALRPGDVVVMDNLPPQGRGRPHVDRKTGSGAALSASLLARSEPHREGLEQTQTNAARRQSTHPRSPRTGHRRPAPAHHSRRRSSPVQAPHWHITATVILL